MDHTTHFVAIHCRPTGVALGSLSVLPSPNTQGREHPGQGTPLSAPSPPPPSHAIKIRGRGGSTQPLLLLLGFGYLPTPACTIPQRTPFPPPRLLFKTRGDTQVVKTRAGSETVGLVPAGTQPNSWDLKKNHPKKKPTHPHPGGGHRP